MFENLALFLFQDAWVVAGSVIFYFNNLQLTAFCYDNVISIEVSILLNVVQFKYALSTVLEYFLVFSLAF